MVEGAILAGFIAILLQTCCVFELAFASPVCNSIEYCFLVSAVESTLGCLVALVEEGIESNIQA